MLILLSLILFVLFVSLTIQTPDLSFKVQKAFKIVFSNFLEVSREFAKAKLQRPWVGDGADLKFQDQHLDTQHTQSKQRVSMFELTIEQRCKSD